jgi:hypothetical protein
MFEIVVWRYKTVIFSSFAILKVDLSLLYCSIYTLSYYAPGCTFWAKEIVLRSVINGGFAST